MWVVPLLLAGQGCRCDAPVATAPPAPTPGVASDNKPTATIVEQLQGSTSGVTRDDRLTAAVLEQPLDPVVERFLLHPFETFIQDHVPGTQRIVVLSNLAEYCANLFQSGGATARRAERCMEQLVRLALDSRLSPIKGDLARSPLGDNGLFLSHLTIVLATSATVTRDHRHAALTRRIAEFLASRSVSEPSHHVPSFPGVDMRWPADQAATLYALYVYDHAFGERISNAPIALWLAYMDTDGMAPEWELPMSEVTGNVTYSRFPRGCALSWTVRYLARFAPERAARLWEHYVSVFRVSALLVGGFREWPPGISRAADIDSGPIVMGIGAAATGLGLGASRAVGDDRTYRLLKNSAAIVRTGSSEQIKAVGNSILAKAIELNGDTQQDWVHAQ